MLLIFELNGGLSSVPKEVGLLQVPEETSEEVCPKH